MKIENHIAKIHFTSNDLTKDLRSPQQVIDFTMAIIVTAEQFDTVNDAQICVNNTYNYEITFLLMKNQLIVPFNFYFNYLHLKLNQKKSDHIK